MFESIYQTIRSTWIEKDSDIMGWKSYFSLRSLFEVLVSLGALVCEISQLCPFKLNAYSTHAGVPTCTHHNNILYTQSICFFLFLPPLALPPSTVHLSHFGQIGHCWGPWTSSVACVCSSPIQGRLMFKIPAEAAVPAAADRSLFTVTPTKTTTTTTTNCSYFTSWRLFTDYVCTPRPLVS